MKLKWLIGSVIALVLVSLLVVSCFRHAFGRNEDGERGGDAFDVVAEDLHPLDAEAQLADIEALVRHFVESPTNEAWHDFRETFECAPHAELAPDVRQAWVDAWIAIDRAATEAGLVPDDEHNYTPLVATIASGAPFSFAWPDESIFIDILMQLGVEMVYPYLLENIYDFYLDDCPTDAGRDVALLYGEALVPLIRQSLQDPDGETRIYAIYFAAMYDIDLFMDDLHNVPPSEEYPLPGHVLTALIQEGRLEEALAFAATQPEFDAVAIIGAWSSIYWWSDATDAQLTAIAEVCRNVPPTPDTLYFWALAAGWEDADAIRQTLMELGDEVETEDARIIQMLIGDEETIEEVLAQWQEAVASPHESGMASFESEYYFLARAINEPDIIRPLMLATSIHTSFPSHGPSRTMRNHIELSVEYGITEHFNTYLEWVSIGGSWFEEKDLYWQALERIDPERMETIYLAALNGEPLFDLCPQLLDLDEWGFLFEEGTSDILPEALADCMAEYELELAYWQYVLTRRAEDYFAVVQDERAVPGLITKLGSDSPILTTYAIPALANQGDPSIIPRLEPFLESHIPLQREYARQAIERLGSF
jgi:hypothetical protein